VIGTLTWKTFLLAGNEADAVPLFSLEIERSGSLSTAANATLRRVCPPRWRIAQERLAQLTNRLPDILVFLEPVEQSGVACLSNISGARLFNTPHDRTVGLTCATREYKNERDGD
jgi:hypothetical protein